MHLQFGSQLEFRETAQILFKNCGFAFQLVFVGGMLIMAPTTSAEVRTPWLHPVRRGFNDPIHPGSSEAWLLLNDSCVNRLSLEHEREKHGFSAPVLINRHAGETVAAIDQFFNAEFQAMILRQSGCVLCARSQLAVPGD